MSARKAVLQSTSGKKMNSFADPARVQLGYLKILVRQAQIACFQLHLQLKMAYLLLQQLVVLGGALRLLIKLDNSAY